MSNINRGYAYDPCENTLTLSDSFAKKASKMGTAEYKLLLQFRKDCPGLKVIKGETKCKAGKHAKLTYTTMEGTIALCRDKIRRMEEYDGVKSLSKLQSSPFQYMKTWFLNNYANYAEQGQLDEENYFVPKTKEQMMKEEKGTSGEELPESPVVTNRITLAVA